MERSQSGYIEPMTRRGVHNAARVQAIIQSIGERFTGEPFPSMSSHYKNDEIEMGEYHPAQLLIQDTITGFDAAGDYHCPRSLDGAG